MARQRQLKPEFFRKRLIGKLGPVAALVYEALCPHGKRFLDSCPDCPDGIGEPSEREADDLPAFLERLAVAFERNDCMDWDEVERRCKEAAARLRGAGETPSPDRQRAIDAAYHAISELQVCGSQGRVMRMLDDALRALEPFALRTGEPR